MAKKKGAGSGKAGKTGKAGKASRASGGPKKSRIPRPVEGRGYAIAGLLALLPIALLLLKGRLDLEAAAQRAVIVLVGLMVIERVVAPLVVAVLDSGKKPEPGEPETAPLTSAES